MNKCLWCDSEFKDFEGEDMVFCSVECSIKAWESIPDISKAIRRRRDKNTRVR